MYFGQLLINLERTMIEYIYNNGIFWILLKIFAGTLVTITKYKQANRYLI